METKELVQVVNGVATATSKDVAEMFGKEHKHVMESIRLLLETDEISQSNFRLSDYISDRGKSYPMYLIDRDGFTLLAMGFTGKEALKFKMQYIQAFNKMEAELINKTNFQLPTTFAQALQLAATQAEELEKKQLLLDQQQPKVEVYDIIMESDNLFSMNEVAKMINCQGRNKLFKSLRESQILMLDNLPYQKFIDSGYFKVVETLTTGGKTFVTTKVSNRGIDYICKRLDLVKII